MFIAVLYAVFAVTFAPIDVSEAGNVISVSEVQFWNALAPIPASFVLKVTFASEVQSLKHPVEKFAYVVTPDVLISFSEVHPSNA